MRGVISQPQPSPRSSLHRLTNSAPGHSGDQGVPSQARFVNGTKLECTSAPSTLVTRPANAQSGPIASSHRVSPIVASRHASATGAMKAAGSHSRRVLPQLPPLANTRPITPLVVDPSYANLLDGQGRGNTAGTQSPQSAAEETQREAWLERRLLERMAQMERFHVE